MGTGSCIKRRVGTVTVIKPERAHLFLPRHGRDRKPVPIGEPLVHEWDGAVRSPWPAPAYQAKLFRKQEARRNA